MQLEFLSQYRPQIVSLLRIVTGLLLFQYGVAKLFKFPILPYFANIPPLTIAAGSIELVLGGFLIVGLFSRSSALILSGEMAAAYFIGHMFKSGEPVWHPLNNGGTPAILFCFTCLALAATGPGPWSLDEMWNKPRQINA
jgi:putative oxidoreductase